MVATHAPVKLERHDSELKDRVTAILMLYHEQGNSQPFSVDCRYSRLLDESEQPFVRRMKLDEQWKPIELGWLEEVSVLAFENLAGKNNEDAAVVQIAYEGAEDGLEVFPRTFAVGRFTRPCKLRARCLEGKTELMVYAIPK